MIAPALVSTWAEAVAQVALYLFLAAAMLRAGVALVLDAVRAILTWRTARAHWTPRAPAEAHEHGVARIVYPGGDKDGRAVEAFIEFSRGADERPFRRPMGATCDRPPAGWACSAPRGHTGPCPTYALDS